MRTSEERIADLRLRAAENKSGMQAGMVVAVLLTLGVLGALSWMFVLLGVWPFVVFFVFGLLGLLYLGNSVEVWRQTFKEPLPRVRTKAKVVRTKAKVRNKAEVPEVKVSEDDADRVAKRWRL